MKNRYEELAESFDLQLPFSFLFSQAGSPGDLLIGLFLFLQQDFGQNLGMTGSV